MAELNSGIRTLLSYSVFYNIFERSIGSTRSQQLFVNSYLNLPPGSTILDIGCGPCDILNFLPNTCEYHGYDINPNYIASARKKFKSRPNIHIFLNEQEGFPIIKENYFDIILASGLLHHLEDKQVIQLLNSAAPMLKKNGRLITMDNCYIDNQNKIARWLISKDRGQNVRTKVEYEKLIENSAVFSQNTVTIREDLLRIPYTHIIMEIRK